MEEKNNMANINTRTLAYIRDREELERLANEYFIKECGCEPEYLDKKGNTIFYYNPSDSKRGGEPYTIPVGWMGFGIEVEQRYKNEKDWIACDGRKGEWAIVYHGFGRGMKSDKLKSIIKTIIHDNLRPEGGQTFSGAPDKRHEGKRCGDGVYITPNINIAFCYAGLITLGKKNYKLVVMVRAKPEFIREPTTQPEFWVVDGNSNQLRPYRLLIKEYIGTTLYN